MKIEAVKENRESGDNLSDLTESPQALAARCDQIDRGRIAEPVQFVGPEILQRIVPLVGCWTSISTRLDGRMQADFGAAVWAGEP